MYNENSTESSRHDSQWIAIFLSFMVLYSITLFLSIGSLPFVGPDEPRYAQVAREMYASGDYISPRLCGLLWFEKPALFYWMAAGAYHVFGVNEFAARLPSTLAALTTLAFLCYVFRRLNLLRLGLLISVILATSALWLEFSHAASTDMLLTASLSMALLAAFLSTATQGRTRLGCLMLCPAATGMAMLAKGLIGVLLVSAILILHGVCTRRFLFRRWTEVAVAVVIFTAIVSLWYVPVMLRHGDTFIQEFFVNHHFKRYLSNKYEHPQPAYFYLFVAFAGALPWGFFLLPALRRLRSLRPRSDQRDSLLALAWIWVLVPLAFFSLSTSKLPGYILPIFPALAIILGVEAEQIWAGNRGRLLRATAGLNALSLVLVGVAGAIYLHKKGFAMQGWDGAVYGVPLALGLIAAGALSLGKMRAAIFGPAAAMLVAVAVMAFYLFPQAGDLLSPKSFAVQVAFNLRPQEDILFYRVEKEYAHIFYSNGRVAFYDNGRIIENTSTGDDLDIENRDELVAALKYELREGEPSVILVTWTKRQNDLKNDPRFGSAPVIRQGKAIAIRVWLKSHVA